MRFGEFLIYLSIIIVLGFTTGSYEIQTSIAQTSPSFVRDEVHDASNDVKSMTDTSYNEPPFLKGVLDIVSGTYFSDGKVLYAKIWLNPNITEAISNTTKYPYFLNYAIFIDVDSNRNTGADGIDYMIYKKRDPRNGGIWVEELVELISDRSGQILRNTTFNGKLNSSIPFSLDLKDLNFPKNYKIAFFSSGGTYFDSSYVIPVPRPNFWIETSQSSLIQGSTDTVNVPVNMTRGYFAKLLISILNQSKIGLTGSPAEIMIPDYGTNVSTLVMSATPDAVEGEHRVTMKTIATFPFEEIGPPFYSNAQDLSKFTNSSIPVENVIKTFSFNVKVISPLEWLRSIFASWESVITFASGIFIGHILPWLFNTIKKVRTKNSNFDYY